MFTSSGARTAAAGWEAAEGRLRSTESLEAAAESLGPGEVAAHEGLESSAAVATAGSGAGAGAANSDAAAVVATALDAAVTSDAGSIAFARIASALASASSSSMKRTPSASTALTGPVRPQTVTRLALGWAHASVNVRGLVTASACNDV